MTRDEALRQIAALHEAWSLQHGDDVPYVAADANPHDGKTSDLSMWQADRSAPPEIDDPLNQAIKEILAQIVDEVALTAARAPVRIIEGIPDADLLAYELRAEAAMVQALQQVMDTVADRIGRTQTATGFVREVWDGCLFCLSPKHPGPCAKPHAESDGGGDGHKPKGGGGGAGEGEGDWRGNADESAANVAAIGDSPLVSSQPLGGGLSASVKLEHHEKGTIVRKDFPPSDAIRAPDKQADAEELGFLVGHAMGVKTPAVHRSGDHSVTMEHVKGKTWAEQSPYGNPPDHIVNSREGRMMGLFDVVAANPDRNHGNWMTDEHGHMVGIDHGLAFGSWSAGVSSPFAGHLINPAGNNWADHIDISPHDMGVIKDRLGSLRSDFVARGRGDWHDDVMARLSALEPRAAGTESFL